MIIITGWVKLREHGRDEALALGCEHSQRSRDEPGCLSHNCFIDAEAPERMMFHETWADQEAVSRHFALAESRDFVARVAGLAASPPEIRIYKAQPVDRAAF